PANIVIQPHTQEVKIIDFGISTKLTRENPTLKNPNVLEGTLAYISPEQTGRMNRSLDYRTDFYSLGVTFYEMLTGKLPFNTEDDLELVHCHIAKQPLSPAEFNPLIPPVISNIVMKLMAKNAEDRYQSAWGLKADLETCLQQLQSTGNIDDFILGIQDISDKFQIPQKLYGRDTEINTLLTAFERVSNPPQPPFDYAVSERSRTTAQALERGDLGGSELMLIAGYSGIGKSALVQEIYKPITEKRGYFIAGKFDQFQRNIPYSAIISAFEQLVKQILTESDVKLQIWKEKLLTALGVNAQVIIDVIPEIELIIGQQQSVPELGGNEAQNRFNLTFQNFIQACGAKEHPLVIFMDDLQWADMATLKLIELMMTDTNLQYLFFIGAYRDNEVNQAHPLLLMLDELGKFEVIINQITLTNLKIKDISKMISDTLKSDLYQVNSLAELVLNKTGGNPFFVNQFLRLLYTENLINFDYKQQQWQWDINQIAAQNITDNVVELMIGKLKKLPDSTQKILQLAACVGANFDLLILSLITEKTPKEIFPDLITVIESGLILPLSELDEQLLIQDYQFLHDRVQQAAYTMIPELEKQEIHLKIGRLLLTNTPSNLIEEQIFDIVNQLNQAVNIINNSEEKIKLAELNLMAGHKATVSIAYQPAVEYLNIGLELLDHNSWKTHYQLTLALHESAAKAAYLNGNFEAMEKRIKEVRENAKNQLDQVQVYEIKIQACIAQSKLREAVQLVLQAVSVLGVNISEQSTAEDTAIMRAKTADKLINIPILNLSNLPNMSDPRILAVMRLLGSANAPAYTGTPELLALIVCQEVTLSIDYGNSAVSALAYAYYGAILCGDVESIPQGYQFGEVALKVLEKFDDKQIIAKTKDMVYGMIKGWKVHLKETLKPLQDNYQVGRDNGTFDYAGYSILKHCYYCFLTGQYLGDLEQKLGTYIQDLTQLKQLTAVNYLQRDRQAILNLINGADRPGIITGSIYNEAEKLPLYHQVGDQYGLLYFSLSKLILSYLFQDYEMAIYSADLAEINLAGGTGLALVAAFYFYDSLARLAMYSSVSKEEQQLLLLKVNNNQEKMQSFANHAPMNFQ
ncbi:MAG TPA: serine/threonine-protein kinase PknK, partial [Allocoleopsis sp.]